MGRDQAGTDGARTAHGRRLILGTSTTERCTRVVVVVVVVVVGQQQNHDYLGGEVL